MSSRFIILISSHLISAFLPFGDNRAAGSGGQSPFCQSEGVNSAAGASGMNGEELIKVVWLSLVRVWCIGASTVLVAHLFRWPELTNFLQLRLRLPGSIPSRNAVQCSRTGLRKVSVRCRAAAVECLVGISMIHCSGSTGQMRRRDRTTTQRTDEAQERQCSRNLCRMNGHRVGEYGALVVSSEH